MRKSLGGENMRKYIKPVIEYILLTAEENFASGSPCKNNVGSCPDIPSIPIKLQNFSC